MKLKYFFILPLIMFVGCSENKTVNESKDIDTHSTAIVTQIDSTELTTEDCYDIPEIIGMTYEEAKSVLEEIGLVVEREDKYSDDVPAGCVISYPQIKYNKDQNEIFLSVSKGKSIRIYSLLMGKSDKTITEQIKIIEDNGIKTEVEYEVENIGWYDVTNPQEMILDINPSVAAKGETVKLSISKPIIQITDQEIEINSAGGCSVPFTIKNLTDKQIAYINIDYYFYNTMGDPAYCDIKNQYVRRVRLTGPINGGEEIPYDTEPIIYNSTVGAVFPKLIIVEYTDGDITAINNVAYWSNGLFYGGQLKD